MLLLLAIGFVSGVVCFQAFSLDKSMKIIKYSGSESVTTGQI